MTGNLQASKRDALKTVVRDCRTLLALTAVCLLFLQPASAEVRVLASIKPLALLVAPLLADRGEVTTLLPATVSAHDYALRVSDMSRLQEAELVLWVGPEMERFLAKPMDTLGKQGQKQQLLASGLPGLVWPEDDHEEEAEGHKHSPAQDDAHHHDRDPHLWLNPENAMVIVAALVEQLSRLDPEGEEGYRQRGKVLTAEIRLLDRQLAELLAPVAGVGFVVYHQGYGHWVSHFGLQQLAAVTVTPEQRPGARHLYQLQQLLAGKGSCLFTEPYYSQVRAKSLAQELGLSVRTLDPMASKGEVNSYSRLLNDMANAMVSCLGLPGFRQQD